MVKFALYILVLVIFAYGSLKLGLPKLHFVFLVAILGSVAGMVMWPLFRPVFSSIGSLLPTSANRNQDAEPQDINEGRFQKVLTKEVKKAPEPRVEPKPKPETATVSKEEVAPELPSGPTPGADSSFEALRADFARSAVYAFRPYPPHRTQNGRSKIGGLPDLPKGVSWPTAPGHGDQIKADLPLHFLAQIDLADLPWRPKDIPDAGMLLFFGRFDESLSWAEADVAPENDIRVIFDPDYTGTETPFPKSLPPLRDGNYHFDLLFGLPGDEKTRTFPEWPLAFVTAETMPQSSALPFDAPEGYDAAHKHLLTEQLKAAFGTLETDNVEHREFHLFQPRTEQERAEGKPIVVRPHSETGFPFAPRGIALICRILRNRHAAKLEETSFDTCFEDWQGQAEGSNANSIDQRMVNAFIEDLNDFLARAADKNYGTYLKSDIERALHRLVTEAGANPDLAKHLPEALYVAAADRHPVFLKDASNVKCPDYPRARSSNTYHQLFGHPSSAQLNLSPNGPDQLLFQLFSDWGAEMSMGDGGEFHFMINESDLNAQAFENVSAAHSAR